MEDWRKKLVDSVFSIIFAIFAICVVAMIICPIISMLLGVDDFDGYFIIIMIQGIQLAATFFAIKQLSDAQKK